MAQRAEVRALPVGQGTCNLVLVWNGMGEVPPEQEALVFLGIFDCGHGSLTKTKRRDTPIKREKAKQELIDILRYYVTKRAETLPEDIQNAFIPPLKHFIDIVVISHADADHIDLLDTFLSKFATPTKKNPTEGNVIMNASMVYDEFPTIKYFYAVEIDKGSNILSAYVKQTGNLVIPTVGMPDLQFDIINNYLKHSRNIETNEYKLDMHIETTIFVDINVTWFEIEYKLIIIKEDSGGINGQYVVQEYSLKCTANEEESFKFYYKLLPEPGFYINVGDEPKCIYPCNLKYDVIGGFIADSINHVNNVFGILIAQIQPEIINLFGQMFGAFYEIYICSTSPHNILYFNTPENILEECKKLNFEAGAMLKIAKVAWGGTTDIEGEKLYTHESKIVRGYRSNLASKVAPMLQKFALTSADFIIQTNRKSIDVPMPGTPFLFRFTNYDEIFFNNTINSEENACSIITQVLYRAHCIAVFPGDATTFSMFWVNEHFSDVKTTGYSYIFTAPHHGSYITTLLIGGDKTKVDADILKNFLNIFNPFKIVISAGYLNTHGHPNEKTIIEYSNWLSNTKSPAVKSHSIIYNSTDDATINVGNYRCVLTTTPMYTLLSYNDNGLSFYEYIGSFIFNNEEELIPDFRYESFFQTNPLSECPQIGDNGIILVARVVVALDKISEILAECQISGEPRQTIDDLINRMHSNPIINDEQAVAALTQILQTLEVIFTWTQFFPPEGKKLFDTIYNEIKTFANGIEKQATATAIPLPNFINFSGTNP